MTIAIGETGIMMPAAEVIHEPLLIIWCFSGICFFGFFSPPLHYNFRWLCVAPININLHYCNAIKFCCGDATQRGCVCDAGAGTAHRALLFCDATLESQAGEPGRRGEGRIDNF